MEIKSFEYKKDDVVTEREVMILKESDTFVEGVETRYLSDEEMEGLKEVQAKYMEMMKPYMKAYRRYLKSNMQD